MKSLDVVVSLAALAQESRLALFRLLVKRGPEVPVMLLVVSVVNCSKGWHEHNSHPIAVKP